MTPLRPEDRLPSGSLPRGPWNVLIVGPSELAGVEAEASRVEAMLDCQGHHVSRRLAPRSAWQDREDVSAERPDLIIVLGGDGSILRTARWLGYQQAPVLGVNLGRLGFLADVSSDEVEKAFTDLAAGRFRCVDHLMLECDILRGRTTIHRELGLNETSILAGPPFSMIEIALHVDGELATTYRADGLIVSTPVGSTAHNLSAGGPIVRKDLEAFIFTPLNPHTLTNRPVVDSAAREYELVVPQPNPGSACVVDGRVIASLAPGDRIRVRRAAPRFTLIQTREHGYYRTLREKLSWGGGARGAGPQAAGESPAREPTS
ncbi:MAG: NAD(+)/NADH kinase [Planctomycetota bacterium]|jgi:NAD+ kinase|nr:NAD(+)/NADH kinase [Planctomycetota bacterium]